MEGLRIIKGKNPGPVVVILASLHGSEPAGMAAYAMLKRHFIDEGNELAKGELRLLKGNIEARAKGIRYLKYDLNRMFFDEYPEHIDRDCYEYKRAQELKEAVLGADYVIDLHSTTSEGEPFSIMASADHNYPEIMINIPVSFTSSGWSGSMPGLMMDWLLDKNIEYVAVECGMNDTKSADQVARKVAMAFLNSLGMTDFELEFERPKRHLKLFQHIPVRDHATYYYPEGHFASFDPLEPNQLIATDKEGDYRAPNLQDLVIVMPGSEESIRQGINHDAYFLGQFVGI